MPGEKIDGNSFLTALFMKSTDKKKFIPLFIIFNKIFFRYLTFLRE